MRTTNADVHRTEEFDTRRIILLQGKPPEVLLEFEGNHRSLPTVSIPRWQRVADNLVAALRSQCNIAAISIYCIKAPGDASSSVATAYEVMEPCKPSNEAPVGKYWVLVAGLTEDCFRDPSDFHALRQAAAQGAGDTEGSSHAPFEKLGWFEELENWVQEQLAPHGLHLNGRFRQLNASPTFSLIRFETNQSAVWFKAVGAPNEREYSVTLALARLFPHFVPWILAARPEWNAWLAREAEGPLLADECCGLQSWKAAARDLAKLQVESLGRSLHLLEAGARDLRARSLSARVAPFFTAIVELMGRQTKTSPALLTSEELSRLSEKVQEALAVLEESDIPASLGQLDFNPGNVIAPLSGCVFLDWAEAFIGHPFLTFEYLREHFRRTVGSDPAQEAELVSCYSFAWRGFVSEREIQQALEVVPLLAVFACAAGGDLWMDPERRSESGTETYLRSLTRRMHREASKLSVRSVPCPS